MKFSLSLIVLFLMLAQAFGQNSNIDTNSVQAKHKDLILSILDGQQSRLQEKPTGIKQRVIAQTMKGETINDSASFRYSGTRGSEFNYNRFTYNSILEGPYEPSFIYPRNMKGWHMLADTITYFIRDTFSYKDYAVYRPDNKCSFIFTEYNTSSRFRSSYIYNSNGDMEARYSSLYSGSVPTDTSSILKYSYENNKLMTDSAWLKDFGVFVLLGFDRFYYSASGKLEVDSGFSATSSSLAVTNLTYYTDGKLRTITTTIFSGNTIREILKDSLGYTGNLEYLTFLQSQSDNFSTNLSWSRVELKYPGINGLPDSTTVNLIVNGSESETIYRYQYNDFDNPEEILAYTDGNPTPYQTAHFYYETYNDGLAINEFKSENDLTVYPNPFSNQINLESKSLLNQNYTLRLLNVVGSEVFSTRLTPRDGKTKFSLPQLSPGFYTLLVQSSDGRLLSKKVMRR
jgi:hypothetical protein